MIIWLPHVSIKWSYWSQKSDKLVEIFEENWYTHRKRLYCKFYFCVKIDTNSI